MSAMTTAMTPFEHELSQTVGLALAVVDANPAAVEPIQFAIHQTIRTFEFALADFDTEAATLSTDIDDQLAKWRSDRAHLADLRRDEWWHAA